MDRWLVRPLHRQGRAWMVPPTRRDYLVLYKFLGGHERIYGPWFKFAYTMGRLLMASIDCDSTFRAKVNILSTVRLQSLVSSASSISTEIPSFLEVYCYHTRSRTHILLPDSHIGDESMSRLSRLQSNMRTQASRCSAPQGASYQITHHLTRSPR